MSSPPTIQDRKSRFRAGLPAVVHAGGAEYTCTAHDLSRSGALLRGKLPPPTHVRVRLTLHSAAGDLVLQLEARVARVDHDGDSGETCIGVAFPPLGERETATLDALVARVVEGTLPAVLATLPRTAPPARVRETLEQIPLAHRMALALRAGYPERALLMHDSSPQVAEALTRNAAISQQELHRLARRRDLPAPAIEYLAGEARWQQDEELTVLLATHPKATLAVAQQLIARLSAAGLRKALLQPSLHPELKAQIVRQGKSRSGRHW